MDHESTTQNKMIVVDIEKCLACGSCEISCAVAHSESGDLITAVQKNEEIAPRITIRKFGDTVVPVLCQHCKNPPCAKACPTDAIRREGEGEPVILHRDRCDGRLHCINACPFDALRKPLEMSRPFKCDLCIDRLRAGREPACVTACPTGALQFREADQTARKQQARYIKNYTALRKSQDKKTTQEEIPCQR